ncbi:MAG: DUF2911 domain-containing protein [Candidatus Pseudobacter hemicellulosilyticus]|uniref:DUF2911 domain-containing protein n=1 Tax=Candidatus Pseudobacter hemicellulosilyticus TaxID=3121375 RepID=A0AAJ5WW66_9BACT|nr:MAG: DUF2911 domain-containing protein [Pseudobacter sp.]
MKKPTFTSQLFPVTGLLLCGLLLAACNQKTPAPSNTVTTIKPTHVNGNGHDQLLTAGLDKSPMDMVYYPIDYPKLKMSRNITEPLVARVIYSRPQKGGRTIFGEVLPYGHAWRMGANEATEIEFFRDVTINKQTVPKGRYVLYGIPYEDKWTIVLNSDLFTWGLKIDSSKDAFQFTIPIRKTNYPFEIFTMEFEKATKGMQLVMEWDSVQAKLPILF